MAEVGGRVKRECIGNGDGGLSVSIAKTMSTLMSREGSGLWGLVIKEILVVFYVATSGILFVAFFSSSSSPPSFSSGWC